MVRTLALAALFAAGLAAGYILGNTRAPAPPVPAPPAREGVAWVNVPAIAHRSHLGKQHALALKARRDELELPSQAMRREYIERQSVVTSLINCMRPTLNEELTPAQMNKLVRQIEELQRRIEAQLKLEAQARSAELNKQLAAVAEEVAHREGFRCVVLWTDAPPLGAPGTDLTERVLAALDARCP